MSASGLVDQHGRPLLSSSMGYYQGTVRSRTRRPMNNEVVDSRNTQTKWARETLLGYSRHLFVNIGEVRGAIKDVARYSVGSGIRPVSLGQDVDEAKAYEDFFDQWSGNCDLRGEYNFWKLQRLASIRMDIDGDIGFNMVSGSRDWPFLQAIEGHQIVGSVNDENNFDGVRISPKTQRAVSYSIRTRDGGFKKVPANNFIMVYDPDRVAQYRGVSALQHAITEVWDTSEILDYEKVGVKIRSAIGAVIKTQGGDDDDAQALIGSENTAAKTGDVPWQTFEAGMIPRLHTDEDIQEIGGNSPSTTFNGFIEMLMRRVALGYGLPLEFVWDLSKAGGASQRAVLAKSQRVFDERFDVLKKFNNRVWAWVIAKGIKRGDLKSTENWWKAKWQQPKKITVDVGREAKESREDVKLGLKTFQDEAGERGQDWRQNRSQTEIETRDLLSRAQSLSAEFGIEMGTALSLLSQRTPNPEVTTNDAITTK